MPKCHKCNGFFPPGYVEKELCLFCIRDVNRILYADGRKSITKKETVKEYKMYLNELANRAKFLDDIPESIDITKVVDVRKDVLPE